MKTYPLLQCQLAIFLQCMEHPTSTQYNLPSYAFFPPTVDVDRFADALQKVFKHSREMRTRFLIDENGEVRQWWDDAMTLDIVRRKGTSGEAVNYILNDFTRPFDLLSGEPLFRCELWETEKGCYMVWDGHHSVLDGMSFTPILTQIEITKAYAGEELDEHPYSIYEAAEDEVASFGTDVYERAKQYYAEKFAGMEFCTLSNAQNGSMGKMVQQSSFIDCSVCDDWSKDNGVAVNLLFQAAFSHTMAVLSRKNKVAYYTVNHGRMGKRLRTTFGMYVKSVPVLADESKEQTVLDYIKSFRMEMMSTIRNGAYPFNHFCRDLGMTPGVSFNFQAIRGMEERMFLGDEKILGSQVVRDVVDDDLSVFIFLTNDERYEIRVESSSAMNSAETCQKVADIVKTVLCNMMAAPEAVLSDIALVSAEEEQQILSISKGETLEYDTTQTWLDLFRNIVEKTPDAVAVVDANGQLTYAELDLLSDKFRTYINNVGIKQEEFIAIRMDRDKRFMAAVLGAHKAGVAYMPIDKEYPQERVDYMMEDSGARLLVDEAVMDEAEGLSPYHLAPVAAPESLAYMIYTSGSTGKPKGVMIQHKALLNFVHFIRKEWHLNSDSRIACHSNFAFDAAVEDLYPVLTVGGVLFILPEEVRMDISLLRNYIESNNINGGCYTTQLGQLLGSGEKLDVNYLCVGGEKMTSVPNITGRVLNTYGPTEFTVDSTYFEVDPEKTYDNIPIGRPLYNLSALILDTNGHLLPQGMVGELCMAGPQMAKGYWNRPELTAQQFREARITGFTDKVYHTGDLARYNSDGMIEYMGRIDFQVKLRGFRIELGEIENRASQYAGVQMVAAEVKNGQTLCLYFTAQEAVDTAALKTFMAETLAEYMVPGVFMQLDEMPLTPNGKVNRKALPEPVFACEEIVAAETEEEKNVFDIASEILKTDQFGVTTNLVSVGLSSLAAMRLSVSLQRNLGIQVKMADIMKHPTIREILQLTADNADAHMLVAHDKQDIYPLSENQRGVYVDWEMNRDTTQYNIPFVYRFANADAEKIVDALRKAIDAHSYVKTRLVMTDGDVMQQRHDDEPTIITVEKLSEEPDTAFFQQQVRPFNVFEDALYRMKVYETPGATYLFADMHHLVYDGLSSVVLLGDVMQAFNGEALMTEQLTAYDFALYEQEVLADDKVMSEADKHFDSIMDGTNALSYPLSSQPDGIPACHLTHNFKSEDIMQFCAANNVTVGSFLQAAFAQALGIITREENPMYLTISNGRGVNPELNRCVGMFVKTLPVSIKKSSADTSVVEYVSALHQQLQKSYELDFYPYTRVMERHRHHAEVMFVYQGGLEVASSEDGIEEIPLTLDAAKFPLDISVYPEGDHFVLLVEYDGTMYNKHDMEMLAKAVSNAAETMANAVKLSDIALVSTEEEQQILSMSKGETLEYDTTQTWLDLFRSIVAKAPDAVAVVDANGQLTYAELDLLSDKFRTYINNVGIKPEEFIAIRMDRDKRFMAAVLGAHKAGVAYMPIDKEYPQERVDYMMEDSGARLLVDEAVMDEAERLAPDTSAPVATPDSLAYMIYTSGSTGKPKGVMIQHKALLNFVHFIRKEWHLNSDSRIACHSNFAFDAAVEDLYPVLTVGGVLFILPEEIRMDISLLRNYIESNHINGGCYTTQLGQLLGSGEKLDVNYLCVGGEKMTSVPNITGRVLNTYGPTEFTVDSTYFEVDSDKTYDNIPIGRPLYNLSALILDANGHLLPQGMVGELCMAGPQMAKGYWNRPELTAQQFREARITGFTDKVYHTGDLARYNSDGMIEYMGRIDFQVKLRGFRIELGEIENRASQYAGVQMVAAEVKNGQTLCLYFTAQDTVDTSALKTFMAETLAEYMVPGVFMQLDEMPLTPNGKVNRKALPEPVITSSHEYVEPATPQEQAIAQAMEQILGITTPVGALDNFFEMGGDSIKAIRMVSILREQGVSLQVADVLKEKTVRKIATKVSDDIILISQEAWTGEVKDSAIVAYFWNLNLPRSAHYLQTMMLDCKDRIDINALQAALDSVTRQHDMLRAIVIADSENNIHLNVRPADAVITIEEENVATTEDVQKAATLVQQNIDMEKSLMRVVAYHTPENDYLFIAIHHLVVDGVSWRILLSDLEAAYAKALAGEEISLPEKTHSYRDFVEAQHHYLGSYKLAQETAYWDKQHNKMLALPTSDGKDYTRRFASLTVTMDEADTKALINANMQVMGLDINDVLMAGVSRSFASMTGGRSVSFLLEGHGREEMDTTLITDRTIGWFTSEYPVIVEGLDGDCHNDLRITKEALHRVPNKGIGYNILKYIGKRYDSERVAQINFNYLGEMDAEQQNNSSFFSISQAVSAGEDIAVENCAGPDLNINCEVKHGRFEFNLSYNADAYPEEKAMAFSENVLKELSNIVSYLASMSEKEHTASDLGENEWTDEEFRVVEKDFASRGEKLERIYPLLPMQEGMLLKQLSEPESLAYRMITIFDVNTLLTEQQLRNALDMLAEKHEVLRTSIIYDGVNQYRQAIVSRRLGLRMTDISDVADKNAALMAMRHDIMVNDYDLQRKPLMQITCAKTSADKCSLIIATHHIIEDGWCLMIYLRDLLSFLTDQNQTVSDELDGRYESAVREILSKDKPAALKFWKDLLADYETRAEIPSWGEVPEAELSDDSKMSVVLSKEITDKLTALCQHEQATINNAVELIWGMVLQTYSRTNDAVFAKVVSGRDNTKTDVNEVVGLFINSIPVRVKCEKGSTARQMLSILQKQTADSNAYDFCPLAEVQQQSELGSQLLQTVLAFENYNSGNTNASQENQEGLHFTPVNADEEIFDELNVVSSVDSEGRLGMEIVYNNHHYRQSEIERVIALFKTFAEGIAENPDTALAALPRLSAEAEQQMADISCGQAVDYDTTETWLDMFHRHVESQPDHIALVDVKGTLTYKQLDEQSDRLASYLVAQGVKADDFVAIKMGRVKEFIVAVMGIQKTGSAYVPVDPEYPADRIAYMLEDSEAKIVITEDTFGNIGNPTASVPGAKPENHAYMIYTSGSTGKPKGVVIDHKSVRACAEWNTKAFGLGPSKSNLHHPSFSFDASTFDLFYPLCAGASIHILDEAQRKDLDGMARYIKENNITGMTMSTALGMVLLNQYDLGLDYIMLGGEKFMPVKKTDTKLFNGYGPTEFTCCSSYHIIDQDKDVDIPIGKAVPNSASYICDAEGHLLPQGVQGELCLAGVQTANCYWHREDLTAEKFRTVMVAGKPVRMYCTGDLARYDENGELLFLGRIDSQVKLRGFRIELGEIENRGSQYADISQVAAEVKNINGQQHLVLYFSAKSEIDKDALQTFMAETLTEYMVPDVFMQLDEMPMTPGGKINRKALPVPEIKSSAEYVAPATEAEQAVADAMQQVLGLSDAVGALDNFFELGGDSIKAIRLVSMLRQSDLGIQVADVMKYKTVRGIADSASAATVIISQEPWSGVVEDSPIMAFFKDLSLKNASRFHQSLLLKCNGRVDVAALQLCIDALTYQHDMLRALFNEEDRLEVRTANARVNIVEKNIDETDNLDKVIDSCISELDLHQALFIPTLLHTSDGDMLLLATHHAIVDGVSWRVIMTDLETAYQQCLAGQKIQLQQKTHTYNDYVNNIRKYRNSYALSLEIPYWNSVQEQLLALHTSEGTHLTRHFEHRQIRMSKADTLSFKEARLSMLNADVNDLLLAAVGRSYAALCGDDAVSVQLEGHGREPIGDTLYTDRTVGWFTSVYPVVLEGLNEDMEQYLRGVKETLHRIPNKGVGYNILRYIQGSDAVNYPSDRIAQIGFNYLGEMDNAGESADAGFFAMASYNSMPAGDEDNFGPDLVINCEIVGGEFALNLDYNAEAYSAEQAQSFADGILTNITRIAGFLAEMQEKEYTATDLGENEWTDKQFRAVQQDFEQRGERLQRIYPLTPMQEGMLMKHLEEPTSWAYRLTSVYEVDILPTLQQMEHVLQRLGKKYEVLRTAIISDGVEQFRQAIVDRKLGLSMVDVSNTPDPEKAALDIRADIMTNGYDLQRKPLLNVICAKKSDSSCYLIISTHHIIVDGWCLRLYMDDLMLFMQQEINGVAADEYVSTDGNYEAAVREILAKDKVEALGYWRTLLEGYDTRTEIPSWGDVPEAEQTEKSNMTVSLSKDTTDKISAICQQEHATQSNAVELIWGLVLQTYSRTNDAVFAKVVSGRDNTKVDVNETVGLFINSVPVRVKCDKDSTARQMIAALQKQAAESNRYDFCALAEIQQQSELGGQLFQNVLAFENYNSGLRNEAAQEESSIHVTPVNINEENFDEISVTSNINDEGCLELQIIFNNKHYRKCEIERVQALFKCLAEGIAQNPDSKISALPLLSDEGIEELQRLGMGEVMDYDKTDTLVTLFRKTVADTPDNTYVVFKDRSLTYRQVDEITDRLACHLLSLGVGTEEAVGVMIDRSEWMVLFPIAIMKAGGTYTPLDSKFPEDRLTYMCEDAGVKLILADDGLVEQTMPHFSGKVFTQSQCDSLPDVTAEQVASLPKATSDNRFVLLYTSGSTGMPKGVALEHHGIVNFCHWYVDEINLVATDHTLAYANFGFDAHMIDIYPSMVAGACVYILDSEIRMDIMAMNQYMEANNMTVAFMTTQIGYLFATSIENRNLRVLSTGGEKLMPMKKPHFRFYNLYGPTECTIASTFYSIDEDYDCTLIGRPLANHQLYVVDSALNVLPRGIAGELVVCGEGVGRGYLHPAEKDAHKFCMFQGQKAYRTGDLVRWSEDGNIDFIGRIDKQVKLRGLRIELGEIEACAIQFDGVSEVCVDVKDMSGTQNLVCYYSAAEGKEVSSEALKSFMAETLANFMVPEIFVAMDKLPLTTNGKVDRKALPMPELAGETVEIVKPETEAEQNIFNAVSDMLKTDNFGVTNNLVSLGMSSLAAMRLCAVLQQRYGYAVKVADIMYQPTIRAIAGIVANNNNAEIFKAFEKRDIYPITENQRGVYLDWEMNRETTQYNIPAAYRFEDIDADKLADAVRTAIEAHSYLKTRLVKTDTDIMQQPHDDEAVQVDVHILDSEPQTAYFQSRIKPFDLFNDRLYRIEIYKSPAAVYLFVDIHHVVYDGLSSAVFLSDIMKAYDGEALAPETVTAYDFALYEQKLAEGEGMQKAENYFDSIMSGANVLSYPKSKTADGTAENLIKVSTEAGEIDAFCSEHGVTVGSFMHAAFAMAMQRMTREDKPLYLTINNGRSASADLLQCVGMFVKTLPVSLPHLESTTPKDYVQAMHRQLLSTYEQDFYPYTRLVERHGLKAEVMFVYQGNLAEKGQIEGVDQLDLALDTAKFPLTVMAYPEADKYTLYIEYDGTLYSRADMETMGNAVLCAMRTLAFADDIGEMKLVTETEEAELIALGNGVAMEYDRSETLVSIMRRQAKASPDNTFIVYNDRSFTYKELDELTDRLAAYLIRTGIQHEEAVGVMINRSELMFVYSMAVMKAGGTYMPLDSHFPEDRLMFMCEDAGVRTILCDDGLVQKTMPAFAGTIFESSQIASLPSSDGVLFPEVKATDRMVILFTSGSTGKPKGVELEQHGIVNYCHAYGNLISMKAEDRIVAYANYGFDVHMMDLYPPMLVGASVYILPDDMRLNLTAMHQYIEANGITVGFMTTVIAAQMASLFPSTSLRVFAGGGEKMPPITPPENYRFINFYGPTETSIGATCYDVKSYFEGEYIGKPLSGYNLYVVDNAMNLVPDGIAGELLIAGTSVARGYLNRPELTAEKFIWFNGECAYRSGDLVRWATDPRDGSRQIEFLGRIDGQVKLRGLRIELGEVENRVAAYPDIQQVCVAVKEIGGQQNLVCYYTEKAEVDTEKLKAFIGETLTAFMVPEVYVKLDTMPLTPNGKVNRKALPEPKVEMGEIIEPETETEKKLFAIVSGHLKLTDFGVTNNLISLGLSSLSAMRLGITIQSKMGYEMQMNDLMKNPTIRAIARMMDDGSLKKVSSMRLGDTKPSQAAKPNPLQKRTTPADAAPAKANPLQKREPSGNPLQKRETPGNPLQKRNPGNNPLLKRNKDDE